MPLLGEGPATGAERVAKNRWLRLFIKNTALCKLEGSIGCDIPGAGRLSEGLAQAKLLIEAPVNGGRNYNGPKVAKFLVG